MKYFIFILLFAAVPTVAQAQVWADDDEKKSLELDYKPIEISIEGRPDAAIRLKGRMVSQGHFRNDNDFDDAARYFDIDGQTEGQIATFFTPMVEYRETQLRVLYEPEFGWNAWSQNDAGLPNTYFESDRDGLVMRHRQMWSQWRWKNRVSMRVGYQHFADPSRLFLDHVGGAARVDIRLTSSRIALFVGQLPDDTVQGIGVSDDNFVHDNVVGGLQARHTIGKLQVVGGAYALLDARVPGKALNLYTGLIGLNFKTPTLRLRVHGLAQGGAWKNSGVRGVDQRIGAWAAQGRLELRPAGSAMGLRYGMGVLALSADDAYEGNEVLGSFFTSGKNASPSIYLTEDERRDRYDNIDERVATSWGSLFLNRAGIMVIDAFVQLRPAKVYRPTLVVAYGQALETDNAMGHSLVGAEATLLNTFPLSKRSAVYFNLHGFLPGGAATVFVNEVNPDTKNAAFGGQLGFDARF